MRMSERMKKRQVINHRFHSVFHSAFVTTKIKKSNFYKDLEGLVEWKDTIEKRVNKKNDKTTFCMILLP